jgi:hypothetical protein
MRAGCRERAGRFWWTRRHLLASIRGGTFAAAVFAMTGDAGEQSALTSAGAKLHELFRQDLRRTANGAIGGERTPRRNAPLVRRRRSHRPR